MTRILKQSSSIYKFNATLVSCLVVCWNLLCYLSFLMRVLSPTIHTMSPARNMMSGSGER